MSDPRNARYRAAGVDIDAGNRLVEAIKPQAAATKRPGVVGGLGGFGAVFDLKAAGFEDALLVSTTDGVGTKLKLAHALSRHDTIGIDLVAMCVNDLLVQGATPLFFLDYYATGALEPAVAAAVIAGIAQGCAQAQCALVGGETAEMPGLYAAGDYDLAGFAVGAVARAQLLPRGVVAGDVLLGLASAGFHSNGFALVRHTLAQAGVSLDTPPPFSAPEPTLGEALLRPTRIYVRSLLPALASGAVHALAHITGGGLTENLPRILPETLAAELDTGAWRLPAEMAWLQQLADISPEEMLRTFNCGLGMVLVVDPAQASTLSGQLRAAGETVFTLGQITPRGAGDAVRYRGALG